MRIRIEFQGSGFVAVPNHVAAMVGDQLSPESVGVLVMLALRPVGSDWAVASILTALGCSRDRWQRISRELRAVGAVWDEPGTGEDGRHRGRVLCVRWPDAPAKAGRKAPAKVRLAGRKPGKPKAGKPYTGEPEKPKAGKPGFRSSQVIEIVEQSTDENARLHAPSKTKTGEAAAPKGVAAASPSPERDSASDPVGRLLRSCDLALADRSAQAASLGLPYLDRATGQWVHPAARLQIAMNGARL